jgi:hypothetical protein
MYHLLYGVHQSFWSQCPPNDADRRGWSRTSVCQCLHARFEFHPTSIYIEEEALSKSGKVDKTILQISFRDDESQLWLLPSGRYRTFGLNAALIATSMDLESQSSDISSIQPPCRIP